MQLPNDKIYNQHARSTSAALLGLGVQFALSVACLMFYLISRAFAIEVLLVMSLAGLPIWLTLLLIYSQRKQARVEALELEQSDRGRYRVSRSSSMPTTIKRRPRVGSRGSRSSA